MPQCTRRGLATIFLPSRRTLYLILSYVAPVAVRFIKIYRTSSLALYVLLKFIVRLTPQMYASKKNIVRLTPQTYVLLKSIVFLTPRTYTSKSFSVCFSRKIYALILFISRQNFGRALEIVLYMPIGGKYLFLGIAIVTFIGYFCISLKKPLKRRRKPGVLSP